MQNNQGAAKKKILVVDDARSNILALCQILRPTYTTLVAIDGISALKIAKEAEPDLILLDVVMPGMTGFEVLQELKGSTSTQGIPVIFITGLDNAEDEERGFFLGAVDYITKPFRDSIIKARVNTHLKMAEYVRTIEHQCMVDVLTDIPNRRSFGIRLNEEWGRATRDQESLSLLMIDVDLFKNYNDAYGHPQGDVLLQALAKVLQENIKRHADFVARWGGEEFAVLLSNTGLSGGVEVAERLRRAVEDAIVPRAGGEPTSATVSVGVTARKPVLGQNAEDLVLEADMALYEAKGTGRNRICAFQTR